MEVSPLPLEGSSPEAALQELLGTTLSLYSGEHVAQAAYEADLVSASRSCRGCDLASQLEGPDRDRLVSFRGVLVAERGRRPTGMLQCGMFTLSQGCRSQAGIFFRSQEKRPFADDR